MRSFPLFQSLRQQHYRTREIGFHAGTATVNRVQARYRMARSYQGMHLDGYSRATADAYSDLFRLFLTYSAFEQFLTLYRARFYALEGDFSNHPYAEVSEAIRQADANRRILDFLYAELDSPSHKTAIQRFGAGHHNNPAVVAAALRHVFVHGKLGPNSNRGNPAAIGQISKKLCDFLLNFMDTEFTHTLHAFCTDRGIPLE